MIELTPEESLKLRHLRTRVDQAQRALEYLVEFLEAPTDGLFERTTEDAVALATRLAGRDVRRAQDDLKQAISEVADGLDVDEAYTVRFPSDSATVCIEAEPDE